MTGQVRSVAAHFLCLQKTTEQNTLKASMSSGTNEQHTNCCNGRSLVVDVFGTHVLDGLSIDSLLRHRNTLHDVKHSHPVYVSFTPVFPLPLNQLKLHIYCQPMRYQLRTERQDELFMHTGAATRLLIQIQHFPGVKVPLHGFFF